MSSKTTEGKGNWLDFEAIKASATVEDVLAHYGLLERLVRSGDELTGWCPLGTKQHGKKDSFAFNVAKKTFQCFACKQRGSVLDFVAKYQGIHLRESAEALQAIMAGTASQAPTPRDNPETVPAPDAGPVGEESEQTREHPKLAEIAGGDHVASPADDPASPATETIDFGGNPVMPFEQAMMQVINGRRRASELVAVEKKFLLAFHELIAKHIPG
jgi:hypothetical protein